MTAYQPLKRKRGHHQDWSKNEGTIRRIGRSGKEEREIEIGLDKSEWLSGEKIQMMIVETKDAVTHQNQEEVLKRRTEVGNEKTSIKVNAMRILRKIESQRDAKIVERETRIIQMTTESEKIAKSGMIPTQIKSVEEMTLKTIKSLERKKIAVEEEMTALMRTRGPRNPKIMERRAEKKKRRWLSSHKKFQSKKVRILLDCTAFSVQVANY